MRHRMSTTTRRVPNSNIVGVAQDVTESSKNDHAVAAMAHDLCQLVNTAHASICSIDANGKVDEWNSKTAEITKFSKEEAFEISIYFSPPCKSQYKRF
eukprot:6922886-Ditylum_brightwellii.AAC.1